MDKIDFDCIINRRDSACVKWDRGKQRTQGKELLPFWIADMEFLAAKPIREALQQRLGHGIFGYHEAPESLAEAFLSWLERRYGWQPSRDHLIELPGIVSAIHLLIQNLTEPGEAVVIQEPVYYPFRWAIETNDRTVVSNPLYKGNDNRWHIDFLGLEKSIQENNARLLVFCNPHNPVARVWEREELVQLEALCRAHEVIVISDEIHADLVYTPHKHLPWPLFAKENSRSITLFSPTKSFNIPGLPLAYAVVSQEDLRDRLKKLMASIGFSRGSGAVFSYVAAEAAWEKSEAWLEALLAYLRKNDDFLREFLRHELPEVSAVPLEGTYLEWLDMRPLGMKDKEMQQVFFDIGFWPSMGSLFGTGGQGHLRLNIACPQSMLAKGLELMVKAFKN